MADARPTFPVAVVAPTRRPHHPRPLGVRWASVLVCRGCCCGTERKHPDVDHDAQLDRLSEAASASVHVRSTGCLGPCADSNVIAVRLSGTRDRVWLGAMLSADATDALARWMADGCMLPVPADLASHQLGASSESSP